MVPPEPEGPKTVSGGNSSRPTVSEQNKGCKDNDHPNICLLVICELKLQVICFEVAVHLLKKVLHFFMDILSQHYKTCTV